MGEVTQFKGIKKGPVEITVAKSGVGKSLFPDHVKACRERISAYNTALLSITDVINTLNNNGNAELAVGASLARTRITTLLSQEEEIMARYVVGT